MLTKAVECLLTFLFCVSLTKKKEKFDKKFINRNKKIVKYCQKLLKKLKNCRKPCC